MGRQRVGESIWTLHGNFSQVTKTAKTSLGKHPKPPGSQPKVSVYWKHESILCRSLTLMNFRLDQPTVFWCHQCLPGPTMGLLLEQHQNSWCVFQKQTRSLHCSQPWIQIIVKITSTLFINGFKIALSRPHLAKPSQYYISISTKQEHWLTFIGEFLTRRLRCFFLWSRSFSFHWQNIAD